MSETAPAPGVISFPADLLAQNLAQLRTLRKWAAFSQFFFTFSRLFSMPDVSLADIENDLARTTNLFLPRIMARLLRVLSGNLKVGRLFEESTPAATPTLNPIGPEPRKQSPQPRFWYSPVEPVAEEDKEQDNVVHLYTDRPLSGQRGGHDLAWGSTFPEQREEETKDWLNLTCHGSPDWMDGNERLRVMSEARSALSETGSEVPPTVRMTPGELGDWRRVAVRQLTQQVGKLEAGSVGIALVVERELNFRTGGGGLASSHLIGSGIMQIHRDERKWEDTVSLLVRPACRGPSNIFQRMLNMKVHWQGSETPQCEYRRKSWGPDRRSASKPPLQRRPEKTQNR
ncbi:hypothetical protein B0H14DRAFT_2637215 [Mycena olivaceomarginata]|nr:hypothetical protein B0H14DRAFT_2637215 [Mycena olivaceomarginata]